MSEREKFLSPGVKSMAQVLMVLPFSPNPIRYGVSEVVAQFGRYAEVDILCLSDGNSIHPPEGVRQVFVVPNASKLARIVRIMSGLLRGCPIGLEYYNSLKLPRVLSRINASKYDVIYVKRLPLHRLNLKHPRILYDADDCWTHKSSVMSKTVPGFRRLLYQIDTLLAPRHEAAACNSAHVVIAVAEREVTHLRALGVSQPVKTFMHGSPTTVLPPVIEQRGRLVVSFHGKLSYKPNEIALSLLNEKIVPSLDARRFEFRVLGQCPPGFPSRFPGLTFSGFVKSMDEALRASDLSVFPLSLSFGFPTKAWESLAVGVPFVTTPGVIEGLPPMPELLEQGVYVREINEFAAEIERFGRLSLEQRKIISANCRRYVEKTANRSARNAQWDQIMAELDGLPVNPNPSQLAVSVSDAARSSNRDA